MEDLFLLNLLNCGPSDSNKKDFNRFISQVKNEIYKKPFFTNCQICNKTNSKFCESHTIPQFILRQNAINGYLLNTQSLNSTPFITPQNGVKNTQVFKSICCECDSKIFQEYENPQNYENLPTDKMLNQIALKNYLFYQFKLVRDLRMFQFSNDSYCKICNVKFKKGPYNNLIECHKKDKIYYTNQANEVFNAIHNNKALYKLGYYKKLEYKIPIIFQGLFTLYFDFSGKNINNPFSKKINGLDSLHFCLYPFENQSIIFIFYKNSVHKFDKFFEDLISLTLEEQLSVINFLLFAYSEDVFINKNIDSSVLNNEYLKFISQIQPVIISTNKTPEHDKKKLREFQKYYSIDNHKKCPNLLSQQYAC